MILKLIQSPANVGWVDMGEGEDQTHWNYWKREHWSTNLTCWKRCPRAWLRRVVLASSSCLAISPGCGWKMLQTPTAVFGLSDRYALTARHLGRLNGFFGSSRPLPAFPWLGDNLTRQWINSIIAWRTFPWDHPRVVERYLTPENNPLRRMLLEIERFQAKLDLLPRALCHGDTYPSNFMSRHATDGQEQTVALDWALAGIGPVG